MPMPMFRISKQQAAELARPIVRKFAERLIRRVAPDLPVDPATLVRLVEAGIDRAHGHGLLSERDVARFVDMQLAAATTAEAPLASPPATTDEFSATDPVGALSPCPRKRNLRFSA